MEPEPGSLAEYFDGWYAIAARTGARLIGVDFSAEAVRQARELARRLGATADFRVGDLAATGLDAGSADGVLCVDAIRFAPQPDAAYCEIRRILTLPGQGPARTLRKRTRSRPGPS